MVPLKRTSSNKLSQVARMVRQRRSQRPLIKRYPYKRIRPYPGLPALLFKEGYLGAPAIRWRTTAAPSVNQDAEETKQAVEREGRRCILLPGDVADPEFCKDAVERTLDEFGRLDVLVRREVRSDGQLSPITRRLSLCP